MSVITLLTDFGLNDEYVGLMKGVILSIAPSVALVDITHSIEPQDIVQAAYAIKTSYSYFPKGTVHLIVVDPGVGGKRDIIALRTMGHIFIAPDNGVLTLLFHAARIEELVRVENSTYFSESISRTFHGRDIIAPVGAHIAGGVGLNQIGTKIEIENTVRLPDLESFLSENGDLIGKIISVDRFGNLITNVALKQLKRYCNSQPHHKLRIRIGKHIIPALSDTYESAEFQKPLALIGSRGYLEIAVNAGNARKYFNAKKGDEVKVTVKI